MRDAETVRSGEEIANDLDAILKGRKEATGNVGGKICTLRKGTRGFMVLLSDDQTLQSFLLRDNGTILAADDCVMKKDEVTGGTRAEYKSIVQNPKAVLEEILVGFEE